MKTKQTDRQIGVGGEFYSRLGAISHLRECACRWRSLAKSYPYSEKKSDVEALKLAERNEKMADEFENEGISLGFLKTK